MDNLADWQLHVTDDGRTVWRHQLESGAWEEREAMPEEINQLEDELNRQGWERYDREIAEMKAKDQLAHDKSQ